MLSTILICGAYTIGFLVTFFIGMFYQAYKDAKLLGKINLKTVQLHLDYQAKLIEFQNAYHELAQQYEDNIGDFSTARPVSGKFH